MTHRRHDPGADGRMNPARRPEHAKEARLMNPDVADERILP